MTNELRKVRSNSGSFWMDCRQYGHFELTSVSSGSAITDHLQAIGSFIWARIAPQVLKRAGG
jgi:hypothetical protein